MWITCNRYLKIDYYSQNLDNKYKKLKENIVFCEKKKEKKVYSCLGPKVELNSFIVNLRIEDDALAGCEAKL